MKNGVEKKSEEIINSSQLIKVFLDTNVIFAYLNNNNNFHLEAKASLDALRLKKNVWIIVSYLTMGELISHRNLMKKGACSVQNALDLFDKFLAGFERNLFGGPALNQDTIAKNYKKHSRHKSFIKAGFTDFLLLTQAEEIKNVRILTCDKKMHHCGKTIFGNRIYYLPNQSPGIRSDYPRLMAEIQNNFMHYSYS
ncbi:MAG: hypothetical protein A2359_04545 [Candidatus Moranbacteria bacterium RIFOXYB1_FULL_43_19]|nr:MAG: hypothetical protein A2184_02850 [Candidatus Moranbacteria bacterium RIFOXYA1_FULL_44_7]OGI27570.1 MAG: hypothetical protein A2359_04545 [Candidatus Moranbacteria bacterium RIFOXYB1_FULL_43_19]OGI33880.1 MAG: hypothetical protein A2420_01650 [Candidatus Moranbacteria bacterium RIFOXYC1_FULL_44_13]OGI38088.1 MAG: hypothetical protein A2612_04605 [Candidatus Moranbacteria bacterium RIFOXYD1_FULL_44_12]